MWFQLSTPKTLKQQLSYGSWCNHPHIVYLPESWLIIKEKLDKEEGEQDDGDKEIEEMDEESEDTLNLKSINSGQ